MVNQYYVSLYSWRYAIYTNAIFVFSKDKLLKLFSNIILKDDA